MVSPIRTQMGGFAQITSVMLRVPFVHDLVHTAASKYISKELAFFILNEHAELFYILCFLSGDETA